MKSLLLLLVSGFLIFASALSVGKNYVVSDSTDERLEPAPKSNKTNTIYKGQAVEVYEIKNGWARVSEYYNGKYEGKSKSVARWVLAKDLSAKKATEKVVVINSAVAKSIKGSDDFSKYSKKMIEVSENLVKSGQCSIKDFEDMGGWMRSTNRGKGVYFTYCGGMNSNNKVYLNINTGEISH